MASRLADRLSAARRSRFVGRAAELALLRAALAAPDLPFHLLWVFGPGGVGKTSLLGAFARLCGEAGWTATYVDARDIPPSPEPFLGAVRQAMGVEGNGSPTEVLAARTERHVLLIDTVESLVPLDPWLREAFLPQLPESALVVLAGRFPPAPAWPADPGWQAMLRLLPLRNLSPAESRDLLVLRNVPTDQRQAVLDFTHGHPLALSLVADLFAQRPELSFQPDAAPDVVRTLLEDLVQKVPGPAHRRALEVCALAHLTTEALLAAVLAMPDVYELFAWLRGLSFIESGPLGLMPHDLAREVLVADLRWRNPDWYVHLHRRARAYYAAHLSETQGQEQQRVLFDYIFLHRDNPVVRPFFAWEEGGNLLVDAARSSDWPDLLAMVSRHEGEESARVASHWFTRQPEGVLVVRDERLQPAGFAALVALHQASPEELSADPAAQAAWRYLEGRAPLRPGECATLIRFWMAAEEYQGVSGVQSLIAAQAARHYLTTPKLAFTFLVCADAEFWAPAMAYFDLARIAEAEFAVCGRRYGVFGHDWRAVPPLAWLDLLAAREVSSTPGHAAPPEPAEPILVLSREAFGAAVLDTLRHLAQPEALRASPLLRSRLVADRAGVARSPAEKIAALRLMVQEAVDALQPSPREAKLYRAIYRTYVQPAPSQEQAAELLDIPFGSFRRHLKAGVERVTEALWRRELGG